MLQLQLGHKATFSIFTFAMALIWRIGVKQNSEKTQICFIFLQISLDLACRRQQDLISDSACKVLVFVILL